VILATKKFAKNSKERLIFNGELSMIFIKRKRFFLKQLSIIFTKGKPFFLRTKDQF
jgi:hypothetical protein